MESFFTTKEVAQILSVSPQALEQWRRSGDGPPWVKLKDGRTSPVRYPEKEFKQWLKDRSSKNKVG